MPGFDRFLQGAAIAGAGGRFVFLRTGANHHDGCGRVLRSKAARRQGRLLRPPRSALPFETCTLVPGFKALAGVFYPAPILRRFVLLGSSAGLTSETFPVMGLPVLGVRVHSIDLYRGQCPQAQKKSAGFAECVPAPLPTKISSPSSVATGSGPFLLDTTALCDQSAQGKVAGAFGQLAYSEIRSPIAAWSQSARCIQEKWPLPVRH